MKKSFLIGIIFFALPVVCMQTFFIYASEEFHDFVKFTPSKNFEFGEKKPLEAEIATVSELINNNVAQVSKKPMLERSRSSMARGISIEVPGRAVGFPEPSNVSSLSGSQEGAESFKTDISDHGALSSRFYGDESLSVKEASPYLVHSEPSPVKRKSSIVVDPAEVKKRILVDELDVSSLQEILDSAHERPAYYGYANDDEITQWYQEARIQRDCHKFSLDAILLHAQKDSEYKGVIRYQFIVDLYFKYNPRLIEPARQAVYDAGKDIFLDSVSGVSSGMQKFLMAYRKVPSGKQDIMLSPKAGIISLDGFKTANARIIVDWMKAHIEKFASRSVIFDFGNNEIQNLLMLLDE